MKTRITELLNIKYPIFQGGMAWIADGDLAGLGCGVSSGKDWRYANGNVPAFLQVTE